MDEPKKIGRPTNEPKTHQIVVRLNEDSSQILLDYCTKNGVNRSEAVRRAILRLMDEKIGE